MHFTNIFLITSTVALALAAPLQKQKRVKNFKLFGVNESGTDVTGQHRPLPDRGTY
jgi:hypothetical protein